MTIPRRLAVAGAGISVAAAVLFTAPAANAATVSYTTTTDPVHAAAGWLATQFENTTHLPAPTGDHFDSKYGSQFFANYGENADAIFGLAAAKAATSKIDVALGYLKKNVDAYADISGTQGGPYDGSIAKLEVAAEVAGVGASSFGGFDLLAHLKSDECAAAATTCTPGSAANIYASVSESLVIIAEGRAGGSHAPSADAMTYFLSLQCNSSGGFTQGTTACGSGAADVDSTSYAIMALQAAGGHSAELLRADTWLRGQENSGGYWTAQNIPNANSTGLAAAALSGQGYDESRARTWLRSQQVARGKAAAGAIKYAGAVSPTTTSATSPAVLATAQALTGLADAGSLATLTATGASSAVPMYAPTATLSTTKAKAGARQSVTADGFVPGEKVHVVVHSSPTTVATATASPLGAVSAKYTLPAAIAGGSHSVVLTGATSGLTVSKPLTVAAAAASNSSSTTSSGTTTTAAPVATQSLAATGQNRSQLDDLAIFGGIAVLTGFGLLAAARRRPDARDAGRAAVRRHRSDRRS